MTIRSMTIGVKRKTHKLGFSHNAGQRKAGREGLQRSGNTGSHVFGRRRERGETGITSLHVGWQRAQRILVLVILMPHMENSQG
jgi:hypothetical protein